MSLFFFEPIFTDYYVLKVVLVLLSFNICTVQCQEVQLIMSAKDHCIDYELTLQQYKLSRAYIYSSRDYHYIEANTGVFQKMSH
jgi:hypothetical protein